MYTIQLYRSGDSWMSRNSDPEVKRLFGTDTIPTAYRAACPAETVLRSIQALNPTTNVTILEARST